METMPLEDVPVKGVDTTQLRPDMINGALPEALQHEGPKTIVNSTFLDEVLKGSDNPDLAVFSGEKDILARLAGDGEPLSRESVEALNDTVDTFLKENPDWLEGNPHAGTIRAFDEYLDQQVEFRGGSVAESSIDHSAVEEPVNVTPEETVQATSEENVQPNGIPETVTAIDPTVEKQMGKLRLDVKNMSESTDSFVRHYEKIAKQISRGEISENLRLKIQTLGEDEIEMMGHFDRHEDIIANLEANEALDEESAGLLEEMKQKLADAKARFESAQELVLGKNEGLENAWGNVEIEYLRNGMVRRVHIDDVFLNGEARQEVVEKAVKSVLRSDYKEVILRGVPESRRPFINFEERFKEAEQAALRVYQYHEAYKLAKAENAYSPETLYLKNLVKSLLKPDQHAGGQTKIGGEFVSARIFNRGKIRL